jgi:hypothetical protein
MAQSSPEGIVLGKGATLVKMELSVSEKQQTDILEVGQIAAKEEPKQEMPWLPKEVWDKYHQLKQETLEEVAKERLINHNLPIDEDFGEGYIAGAILGAKWQQEQESKYFVRDLEYWKDNAEEDYITTPISVLRYISELEKEVEQDKNKFSEEDMINRTQVVFELTNKGYSIDEIIEQFKKK